MEPTSGQSFAAAAVNATVLSIVFAAGTAVVVYLVQTTGQMTWRTLEEANRINGLRLMWASDPDYLHYDLANAHHRNYFLLLFSGLIIGWDEPYLRHRLHWLLERPHVTLDKYGYLDPTDPSQRSPEEDWPDPTDTQGRTQRLYELMRLICARYPFRVWDRETQIRETRGREIRVGGSAWARVDAPIALDTIAEVEAWMAAVAPLLVGIGAELTAHGGRFRELFDQYRPHGMEMPLPLHGESEGERHDYATFLGAFDYKARRDEFVDFIDKATEIYSRVYEEHERLVAYRRQLPRARSLVLALSAFLAAFASGVVVPLAYPAVPTLWSLWVPTGIYAAGLMLLVIWLSRGFRRGGVASAGTLPIRVWVPAFRRRSPDTWRGTGHESSDAAESSAPPQP